MLHTICTRNSISTIKVKRREILFILYCSNNSSLSWTRSTKHILIVSFFVKSTYIRSARGLLFLFWLFNSRCANCYLYASFRSFWKNRFGWFNYCDFFFFFDFRLCNSFLLGFLFDFLFLAWL